MINQVNTYMMEYHMIESNDGIVVGVSGGADSVCLLCALKALQKEYQSELVAVHVHHGLRGAEADRDEQYVKALCERLEIPLEIFHIDVHQIAENRKQSEEEAGREERRRCFEEVMKQHRFQKIALAHHMDDNAETMLWNLFRGTGIRGLSGMKPVAGNYIRPLLGVRRREIETYLDEIEQSYCVDSTNLETAYTRNKLRNQILPMVEQELNSKAVEHMNDAMGQLREIDQFLEEQTKKDGDMARRVSVNEESQKEENERIKKAPVVLYQEELLSLSHLRRSRVFHKVMAEVAGNEKDISRTHIEAMERLLEGQVGRKIDLPYGVCAYRTYAGVEFLKEEENNFGQMEREREYLIQVPGVTKIKPGVRVVCTLSTWSGEEAFPQKAYTKWIDYDIIKNKLVLRTRKPGDRICVLADGGTQKLKQFFVNQKIPEKDRDHMLLLADQDQVVWIVGSRMSKAYQITSKTKQVLKIEIIIDEGE